MKTWQESFEIATAGRGMVNVTGQVAGSVKNSGVVTGMCHVFLHHTSASLALCENCDPDVQDDLERFFLRLVPDGDPLFRHIAEGPDDMSAHVRSILTVNTLSLPVALTAPALGKWQGIYLWEHRKNPSVRKLTITVQG